MQVPVPPGASLGLTSPVCTMEPRTPLHWQAIRKLHQVAECWALSQRPLRAPDLPAAPAPLENPPASAQPPHPTPKAPLKPPTSLPCPRPSFQPAILLSSSAFAVFLSRSQFPWHSWPRGRSPHPPHLRVAGPASTSPATPELPPSRPHPAYGGFLAAGPRGGAGVPVCHSQRSPGGHPATHTRCTCQQAAPAPSQAWEQ